MNRLAALILAALPGVAGAADLHVEARGDDAAAGDAAHPFRTIGRCAAAAAPGDTCWIGPGRYPERVTPPRDGTPGSPITFAARDPADPPVLAGLREVSGFTPYAGAIWQAQAGGSFGALYLDGQRMVLAREPNLASGDPWRPSWFQATANGGKASLIDDVHLTQPAGAWDGAKLYLVAGLGWSADQRDVTGYDPVAHRLDFSPDIFFGQYYDVDEYSLYYLYDRLELLDAPSEWYLDRQSGTVYLWAPAGDDPNGHRVEVEDAPAGFDLTGRSYLRLSYLTVLSGELVLEGANSCQVEDTRLLYPRDEVRVTGTDTALERDEIAWADGRCVYLGGARNALRHSHVHHCDARGGYDELVKLGGPDSEVSDCALHDTGRDGVGAERSGVDRSVLEHNELYNTGMIAKDCGAFYVWEASGGGTVLRYNVVHDVWPAQTLEYGPFALGFGIYFDDGSADFVAHHNVVYGVAASGIFLHEPSTSIRVYNNTSVAVGGGIGNPIASAPGNLGPDASYSELANNLLVVLDDRAPAMELRGAVPPYFNDGYYRLDGGELCLPGLESTAVTGDPLFADLPTWDLALTAGSPYVDQGAVIPGITDGFAGAAPDIGAYELGGAEQPGIRGAVGPAVPDAGPVDAGPPDAGPVDAGPPDAGPLDAGSESDAGPFDAGSEPDAGPADAGVVDAGTLDAGPADAGPLDAGLDAGPADAGLDAGAPDGGGPPDAGVGRALVARGACGCGSAPDAWLALLALAPLLGRRQRMR